MRLCTKCILPETFPRISFDAKGVCNYCRSYNDFDHQAIIKARYRQKFESLVAGLLPASTPSPRNVQSACTVPGPSAYHVLMAYSGGKDSTYTLNVLKNKYHLNVLAVTFDHGFLSDSARYNINVVCENLGIDHMIIKPRFDVLQKIFTHPEIHNAYPPKLMERASAICNSCMGLVKSITLKIALEKNIPMIGYGWSPGQVPVASSVMRINPDLAQRTQKTFFGPMYQIAGETVLPYFPGAEDLSKLTHGFFYNVHPLVFLEYNEAAIHASIKELGWKQPQDTDANSTNCLLNSFANQLHMDKYGYNPYILEIANSVRFGLLTREEGMKKATAPPDPVIIDQVKKKLGYAWVGSSS